MASTSSQIKIIFDGSASGVVAAAGVAKAAISSVTSAVGTATKFTAITAAGAAIGAIAGQALSALPALLAFGAAGGVVVLGMSGIKKAAAELKPAFTDLKTSISTTFQQQLTPVFTRLGPVISALKAPLNEVAVGFGKVRRLRDHRRWR